MKPSIKIISLILTLALVFSSGLFAQNAENPQKPFAIRMNLLGFLNHDLIGELEYHVSDRFGIVVGGGKSSAVVELWQFDPLGQGRFFSNGAGIYAGLNYSIPMGSITGFSVKPIISYSNIGKVSSEGMPIPGVPQELTYIKERIGGYLNIAFIQHLNANFFVEPVIGMGLVFGRSDAAKSKFDSHGLSFPAQLNFGVRF